MTYEILIVKSVSIIKNVVQYFARIFLGNFYNSSSLKSKNILYSMKRINNIKAERKGCFLGILTKFIVVNGTVNCLNGFRPKSIYFPSISFYFSRE
ncbi:uncharacterized protein OCT59_012887 [Rhizophagus irregularis]|uniref:uncharacterized protein n=1 Tax=Rhizophagus irregularis TaxID=588596 RepID=UPI0033177BC3|nr:hypothetical protein OCT59_012887 [Rhizophagus irregularis]